VQKELKENHSDYTYEHLAAALSKIGENWNFDMFFINDVTSQPLLVTA
jgi:hypothetical protein